MERGFKFVDCRSAKPRGGARKRMFEIMNHSACRALLFKMTGIDVGTSDTEE
ncbi:replicative DNA helicase [Vibrio phage JSF9]|uniref:Replicative DNA helicase n=1 Tax=Vibrio phage JSF9 TaxID=1983616 RepID=A0A2D0Z4P0_9CAUD|nr:replicative DNA helicase [Vibrio phage JSF9]